MGAVRPTPLDPTKLETFKARAQALDATAKHWGLPAVAPFKAEEIAAITDRIAAETDIRGKLAMARGFVMSWPSPERQRAALDQLIGDGKLPKAYATALGVAEDGGVAVAERVLGDLLAGSAGLDKTLARDTERNAATAYDDARGAALGHAGAYSAPLLARIGEERQDVIDLAKARALAGARDPVGSALGDLHGRERVMDDRFLAHVVLPAHADPATVRNGFLALRHEAATRDPTTGKPLVRGSDGRLLPVEPLPPPAEGLDVKAQQEAWAKRREQQADMAKIEATVGVLRTGGVWVNDGDGFTLMIPGAGQPVIGPSGRPWRVTLEQVLAIGREQPPEPPLLEQYEGRAPDLIFPEPQQSL